MANYRDFHRNGKSLSDTIRYINSLGGIRLFVQSNTITFLNCTINTESTQHRMFAV